TATITVNPYNGPNGACTGTAVTFKITVLPAPTVNQPANLSVCSGTSINIPFSGSPSGTSYVWTNDNPAVGLAASGTGNISFTSAANGGQETATITVTPQNGASCQGPAKTFTITVFALPTVDQPENEDHCPGELINILFTGDNAQKYTWTNSNPAIGVPASGMGDLFYAASNVSSQQTGIIQVTPVNGTCSGAAQSFSVTIHPAPKMTQPNNVKACAGEMVHISFSGTFVTNYTWTANNPNLGMPTAGDGEIWFTAANGSQKQVATVTVTPQNDFCSGEPKFFTVTINPIVQKQIEAQICQGQAYFFGGQNRTTAGTYVQTLITTAGCDSILTLVLSVNTVLADTVAASICQGETYPFDNKLLTDSGIYKDTLHSLGGCDSIVTLTLVVNPTTNTALSAIICSGEGYPFNGQNLDSTGVYLDTLQTGAGCDSIVTLDLTVFPVYKTTLSAAICIGQTYPFAGQDLDSSGVYIVALKTINGCDSIISLTLTVHPTLVTNLSAQICEGQTYTFGGLVLDSSGIYRDTFPAITGCDSIVVLTLNVNTVLTQVIAVSICAGDHYVFDGDTLTVGGIFVDTLSSTGGCDSLITLTLRIIEPALTSIVKQICAGQSYPFGGLQLNVSGIYTDTFPSSLGCDSIVTLTLQVDSVLTTASTATICAGEGYVFGGDTLKVSGIYVDTFPSTGGCDSIATLTLTVNPMVTTALLAAICEGEAYNFNGQSLSIAGVYTVMLKTTVNCDSIVTLNLAVHPAFAIDLSASICAGQTYLFAGQELDTSGVYVDSLMTVTGCDSIITLTLTVDPPIVINLAKQICQGNSYFFDGQDLDVSGVYTAMDTTAAGCDSTTVLTLSVQPVLAHSIAVTVCAGGYYVFDGDTLKVGGVYLDTLTAAGGCDSIVTLTLTVDPPIMTNLVAQICAGQSYLFDGQNLS
ncbi:MAG: hypothetical protein ABIQ93_03940, partial [Saprospiraceae bacterium]